LSPAAARPRVIINPQSFRASRRGLARRVADAARGNGLEVLLASNAGEFQAALDQLRDQQAEQIWMLAGDGTIHATADYLAQPASAGWTPALLLLGGGRANVVPRDMGGYPPWKRFNTALEQLRAGRDLAEERLLTLRVEQEGAAPRHCFVLAGAVIYAGIRLCQEHRASGDGWLNRSWMADPWVLLKIAAQVLAGRSPLPAYDDLQVRIDGTLAMHAAMRVLMVTTLQMRESLYNPYALRGAGAVRVTAVAADARNFWRNLPGMLKGRFDDDMTVQQGYLSGRFPSVEISGMRGYALDGEPVTADPARAVRLSGGIELRVLRP
jgi:Diacylglycerol kinase catalytic domain